jgi:hypothetical protein
MRRLSVLFVFRESDLTWPRLILSDYRFVRPEPWHEDFALGTQGEILREHAGDGANSLGLRFLAAREFPRVNLRTGSPRPVSWI